MAKNRARAPHRLLRLLLLLLGLAMIGTVAVMLAAHRFASNTQPVPIVSVDEDPVTGLPDDDLFRGEGFEFKHVIEGQPLFLIRAEGIRQDRDEVAHLATVDLELYRENGEVVRVKSDQADYNQATKDAELTGNVRVDGQGLELESRKLLVSRDGQSLASPTPVTLRYPPNLAGRASTMRVRMDNEVYVLTDGVHLHSTPNAAVAMRLDAERLTHRREESVIRAIGKVRLERAGDVITAESLIVTFDEGMRNIRTVRARHGAHATVLADQGLAADRLSVSGEHILVHFNPATGVPRFLSVESDEAGGRARIERIDADGLSQAFTGGRLEGRFFNGYLRRVEGRGAPVILTEALAMRDGPFDLRHACAAELDMELRAGRPALLHLRGRVDLSDGDVYIGGASRADVDFVADALHFSGPDVTLFHDDGQVTADAFTYQRDVRRIRAEGRVAAMLEERASRALRATPLGRGSGPIQVESEKATWNLDPAAFVFTDEVRAWRGENLLFADQLRGDDVARQVSAAGGVRTTWLPHQESTPIQVAADQMVYDRLRSTLVYSGSVDAAQDGRTLACDELRIALSMPDGRAEHMDCEGDVTLSDPALGRQVAGDHALYALSSDQIEVTGDPVTVKEAGGGEVRCRYFRYDTETGAVEIRSTPPPGLAPAAQVAPRAEKTDTGRR